MSSRERMKHALGCEPVDRVPCCFISFTALRRRVHEDMYALVEAEQAMGLDSMLFLPAAPRPGRPLARVAPRRVGASAEGRWARSRSGADPGELNAYLMLPRLGLGRLRDTLI